MNLQTALTTASNTAVTGWGGGRGFLYAYGTWGSGTLTLTWANAAGGTYVPIQTGVSLTADGTVAFEIGAGEITATLSGSTGATVNWGVDITTTTQH